MGKITKSLSKIKHFKSEFWSINQHRSTALKELSTAFFLPKSLSNLINQQKIKNNENCLNRKIYSGFR